LLLLQIHPIFPFEFEDFQQFHLTYFDTIYIQFINIKFMIISKYNIIIIKNFLYLHFHVKRMILFGIHQLDEHIHYIRV